MRSAILGNNLNNIFLCIWGDIFGTMEKFFKISIFNIKVLTGQKIDMAKLKLVWPVNITSHHSKIVLSPAMSKDDTLRCSF